MPIALGLGAAMSFLNANQSKNAQKANQAQQSAIDNQLMQVYNRLTTQYNQLRGAVNPAQTMGAAKSFYQSEVEGGLSPAVIGQAQSSYQQEQARNLATFKNQLGPYTPNLAGAIRDFGNNAITGNVSLQQGLAAQNQNVRAAGAQGLAGLGENVMSTGVNIGDIVSQGLFGLGGQYQQASEFNASNAYGSNPFMSIAQLMLANPNLFNQGGGGTPTGTTIPVGATPPGWYSGPNNPAYPQPGQGGLGTTGGLGTIG